MGIWILAVLAVGALAYGLFGLTLYRRQRKLQYAPTHQDAEGRGRGKFQPWRSADGQLLGYFRPASTPRRLVVLFHGNAGEALDRDWTDELVSDKDLLVLAEYPGYGARPGKISKEAILLDAEKLVTQAQAKWGPIPILAVGEGLGAAVASFVASLGKVDRLALISPFASEDLASKSYRLYPAGWLIPEKYEPTAYLQGAKVPLHVVHGTLDDFAPLEQGRTIFKTYKGSTKHLDEVPGCGHTNLAQALLHSPFTTRFRQFITE